MHPRTWLVALMFATLPLAGCIGGGDPLDSSVTDDTGPAGPTDAPPDGRSGRIVAFEETNRTEDGLEGIDHDHDLWQGRERVTLLELQTSMSPVVNDQNEAFAVIRVPQPMLVFEATGEIVLQISNPQRRACEPTGSTLDGQELCTDYSAGGQQAPYAPDPGAAAGATFLLRYKHASTIQWIDAGPIAWNTPTTIQITNPVQTDMPHSTASLWSFMVASRNQYDTTLSFDMMAEIVRGPAGIPEWPGHPAFYAEGIHTREVLRETGILHCEGAACATVEAGDPVYAQKLISYGTKSLYVWLNITNVNAPNPALAPTHWFLWHRDPTGHDNITNPFVLTQDQRELHWVLPVTDETMDSPYADGSRWNFEMGGALGSVLTCYSGCSDFSATYDLVVHATDEDAGDAYHIYCQDDSC